MFKKLLIFALLVILSPYAKSQLIKGSVFEITDKKEKIPLIGVTIFWIGLGIMGVSAIQKEILK